MSGGRDVHQWEQSFIKQINFGHSFDSDMSSVANPSTLPTFQHLTVLFIFLIIINSASLVSTFRPGYSSSPFNQLAYSYEKPIPQSLQYGMPTNSFQTDGTPQTSPNIMNKGNGTWPNQDQQNVPTYQKNVYLSYRPMPPPPRRRRLLPYFIFGFAAGSAAVIGGAAAATAFRG